MAPPASWWTPALHSSLLHMCTLQSQPDLPCFKAWPKVTWLQPGPTLSLKSCMKTALLIAVGLKQGRPSEHTQLVLHAQHEATPGNVQSATDSWYSFSVVAAAQHTHVSSLTQDGGS